MMLLLTVGTLLFATATISSCDEERVSTSVKLVIGNGTVKENPKARVLPLVVGMDAKGGFWSDGVLFGRIDPGELVADTLKTEDFMRLQIDIDNPDETRATLILQVIDRISNSVKAGKRVELTFTYSAVVKKG
ncbi:MAG: hypothetical protein C0467_26635 [Planctomycetaceae bacterium]|nr:hypothetical protein [Planctomycetaceae bacterium]